MFNNAYSVSLSISGYENGNYSANHTEYNCETDFNLLVYDGECSGYQAMGTVNWRLKLCNDSNWRISQIYDNTESDILSLEITNAHGTKFYYYSGSGLIYQTNINMSF
jgi:hypothetical protein